jgi:hypothetical protein
MFRKTLAGFVLLGGLLAMPSTSKATILDDLLNAIPGGQQVDAAIHLVRDVGRAIGSLPPTLIPVPGAPSGPPPIPPVGVPFMLTYLDPVPPPGFAPTMVAFRQTARFTWQSTRNGALYHEVHRSPEAVIIRSTTFPELFIIHADGNVTLHNRAGWRHFVRGTIGPDR